MKDLPKVYENQIEENIKNSQDIFYGKDRGINRNDEKTIIKKINSIFASKDHVYKSKVLITLKDNSCVTKTIIGKTNTNLITMDNELIKIIDIIDIEKI